MSSRSSRGSLYSSRLSLASLYAIPICSIGAVLTTVAWLTVVMVRAHSMNQLPQSDSGTTFNFVLLLLLTATALLVFRFLPRRLASRVNLLLGAVITTSAFLAGTESLAHRRIVLKFFGNDWGVTTVPSVFGHLPFIVALALVLLGITILLRSLFLSRQAEFTARLLCAGVLLLVFIGSCFHWLEIQLVCDCNESLPLLRMQLAGGGSLLLLAISSWNLWADGAWNKRDSGQPNPWSVLTTSAVVLIATVLLLAVASLTLVQGRMLASVGDSMTQTVQERGLLVERILSDGLRRASSIHPSEFAALVRLFDTDPNSPRTVAAAYSTSQSVMARGFSAVAIQGADRGFLAIGNFIASPSGQVDVKAPLPARLLWANGYLLNVGVPQVDKAGLAGYMVVQIPLVELDKVGPEHSPWGQFTDIDLCGPGPNSIRCFPQRFSAAPFEVEQSQAMASLPVDRALRGEQGYEVTTDLHGERVLAAYGPVGETGIGIALQVRLSELFAPVRRRMLLASPAVAALMLVGLCTIWLRINHLWRRLAKAEERESESAAEVTSTPREEPAVISTTLATQYDFPRPNFGHWVSSSPDLQILLIQVRGSIGMREPLNTSENDLLLQRVSDKIRRCVTQSDTIHSSGQGEFIVALPRHAHEDTAAETAGRISTALSESIMVGGREVSVTSRVSVADYATVEEATDAWLEHSMGDMHNAPQDWSTFTQTGDREVVTAVYDVPEDWAEFTEADADEIIAEVYDVPEDWSKYTEAGKREVIAEVYDAPEDPATVTESDTSESAAEVQDPPGDRTTVTQPSTLEVVAEIQEASEARPAFTEAGKREVIAEVYDAPEDPATVTESDTSESTAEAQDTSEDRTTVTQPGNLEAVAEIQEASEARPAFTEAGNREVLADLQEDLEDRTTVPQANGRENTESSSVIDDWSELLEAFEAEVILSARGQDLFVDDWSELVGSFTNEVIPQETGGEIPVVPNADRLDHAEDPTTEIPTSETPTVHVQASPSPPASGEPADAPVAERNKAESSLDSLIGSWLAHRRARESLELEKLWSLVSPLENVEPEPPIQQGTIGGITELISDSAVHETQRMSQPELVEPFVGTPPEPMASRSEPAETPSETIASPLEPAEEPSEPIASPFETPVSASEPAETLSEPVALPLEPAETSSEPIASPLEPAETLSEPIRSSAEAIGSPSEPVGLPLEPVASASAAIAVREGRVVLFATAVGSFLLGLMISWFADSRSSRRQSKDKGE